MSCKDGEKVMKKLGLITILFLAFCNFGALSFATDDITITNSTTVCEHLFGDEYKSLPMLVTVSHSYSEDISIKFGVLIEQRDSITEMLSEYITEDDNMMLFNIEAYSGDDKISDMDKISAICFIKEMPGGSWENVSQWGKDYRVFQINGDTYKQLDITNSCATSVSVNCNSLGLFAIIYNPQIYSCSLYSDYNSDNNEAQYRGELYFRTPVSFYATDLNIKKPTKEGYTFVKWSNLPYSLRNSGDKDLNGEPLLENAPVRGGWYADWLSNGEYEPLNISLLKKEEIYLGDADGKKIEISLSQGEWADELDPNDFMLVGCETISIAGVDRTDDRTLNLTLSGNSTENTQAADVSVTFPQKYVKNADRYQLNENGTVKVIYSTDNTIKFDVMHHSSETAYRRRRTKKSYVPKAAPVATEPPQELSETESADATLKATTPKILTVTGGEKIKIRIGNAEASFTDVQPFIDENNRTQIPVRTIAEMLNCTVDWNPITKLVTITSSNGDMTSIEIGSKFIVSNEKIVEMDTVAVIKDDRTFIPIGFLAEALGIGVLWETK